MDAVDRQRAEGDVVRSEEDQLRSGHAAALILLVAAVALGPTIARFGFTAFVVLYAVAAGAWLVIRGRVVSFRAAVVIAIFLRALFLLPEPQLSNDVYRYLWDGRTLAAGGNPYARLPDDPRVNHRDIPTIYPPHAELLFALVHHLPLWRLLLLGAEVAVLFLLRGHPRAWLAYATFPPLLFEGAWSAHADVLAGMLLALAYFRNSGAALGAAVGIKIIPIAALPALARTPKFAIAFAVTLVLPFIPFVIAGPVMPGMRDYATRWIFNSPAYEIVRAIVGEDFPTRVILGVIAFALIAYFRRDAVACVGILLLCSPAIHPWYWLVLVPLAIARGSAWTLVALCAPFSYLLYDGVSKWLVFALCYGPQCAASALSARSMRRWMASRGDSRS